MRKLCSDRPLQRESIMFGIDTLPWTRRPRTLLCAACVLIIASGCDSTQRSGRAAAASPPPRVEAASAETAPPASAEAPAPIPTTQSAPPAATAGTVPTTAPADQDRAARAAALRQRIEELRKQKLAAQQERRAGAADRVATSRPAVRTRTQATTVNPAGPTTRTSPPAAIEHPAAPPVGADQAKAGGCGSKGTSAAPTPSPDGPQPQWVCENPKITLDPVWSGTSAVFVFKVGNTGEGPLNIRVKGG